MWNTVLKWAILLTAVAGATCYYSPSTFTRLTAPFTRNLQATKATVSSEPSSTSGGKKNKAKRALPPRLSSTQDGTSTPNSSSEQTTNKKRKITAAPAKEDVKAGTTSSRVNPSTNDDDVSTQEFVEQLAKTQAGARLEAAKQPGQSKKERREAAKVTAVVTPAIPPTPDLSTGPSSTTGREGNDDLSPEASPEPLFIASPPTSRASDVSDMLEAPTAKPNTLRLTNISEQPSKPKTNTKFEQVTRKKQRQRQAKQAEQRVMREEADRLHEAKKVQQLRTARLAEGTSNQTKANAFVSRQNPWQGVNPAQQSQSAVPEAASTAVPLFDTFEPKGPEDMAQPHGAVGTKPMADLTNGQTLNNVNAAKSQVGESIVQTKAASSREQLSRPQPVTTQGWAGEMSEEEQMRLLEQQQQAETWKSVVGKKDKKKMRKEVNDTSSEASSAAQPQVQASKPKVNGTNGVPPNVARPAAFQNQFEPIVTKDGLKDDEWEA